MMYPKYKPVCISFARKLDCVNITGDSEQHFLIAQLMCYSCLSVDTHSANRARLGYSLPAMAPSLLLHTMLTIFSSMLPMAQAAGTCSITCQDLPLIPAMWIYGGEDIPMIARKCDVTGSCDIDFVAWFLNTSRAEEIVTGTVSQMVSVDVMLICAGAIDTIGKYLLPGLKL